MSRSELVSAFGSIVQLERELTFEDGSVWAKWLLLCSKCVNVGIREED